MARAANFRRFDWLSFMIICFLLAISFFFVWSASSEKFAYKQITWIIFGIGIFFVLLVFDYFWIAKYSYAYYIIIILFLIMVLLFGKTVYGAKRWLAFGPATIQPSEFMKIAFILALSRYFMTKNKNYGIGNVLIPLGLTIIPMVLIIKQPDLGTSMVFLPIFFVIMYVAGTKLKYIVTLIIFCITLMPLLWYFVLRAYQKERIISFFYPDKVSKFDEGYQKIQSLIAVGSGGFFGSGWGNGIQSQLNFLPQGHADFIFSVIAEEWGFFGSSGILVLYLGFLTFSISTALKTREIYGRLIVTGFTTMFATQILINISMSVGIIPITGLTLPFISYGGSSLLSSFIALSFIFNVSLRNRTVLA